MSPTDGAADGCALDADAEAETMDSRVVRIPDVMSFSFRSR